MKIQKLRGQPSSGGFFLIFYISLRDFPNFQSRPTPFFGDDGRHTDVTMTSHEIFSVNRTHKGCFTILRDIAPHHSKQFLWTVGKFTSLPKLTIEPPNYSQGQ